MSGKQPSVTELQNELNRIARELAATRKELSLKNERLEMTDQRQRSTLQSIFDSVDIGLLLIDRHGAVRKVNNAITSWLGHDRVSFGSQPGDILHCVNALRISGGCGYSDNCLNCPLRNAFETAQKTNHPVTVQAQSELTFGGNVQSVWFDVRANPLLIDNEPYIILSLNNVTEYRRIEEALRISKNFLRQSHESLVLAQQAAGSGVWDWDIVSGKLVWAHKMTDTAGFQKAFDHVSDLLDESITASRNLAIELSPPVLNEIGLGASLKWMGQWMKEKHDLDVSVSVDSEVPADPKGICFLLFQSVRELLFNVVKHAQTHRAEVVMETYPDGLVQIAVIDTGTGFDSAAQTADSADSGFGLRSIRERLSLVGGQLNITSSKTEGTTAVLTATIW